MAEKQRVLITGGAGFLGSHTTRKLLDMGYDVHVLDFFHQYIYPLSDTFLQNMQHRFNVLLNGANVTRSNLANKEDLRKKIEKIAPHYLVHLAALPLANVALWQTEEAFESIIGATFNILDISHELKSLKKLVYVSSSMVFGDFTKIPMPEEERKEPKEIYGSMKYCGEILVRAFSRRSGHPFIIIRPSALYGPTDNNRRVLQCFVENGINKKPIDVTDPDATYLDFTFVEDAAQGIALATTKDDVKNEDFNITRGEGRSLADALKILEKILGPLEIRPRHEADKFRPSRGALDISKAKRLLGYNPSTSLEDGLRRYVDFVRSNQSKPVTTL